MHLCFLINQNFILFINNRQFIYLVFQRGGMIGVVSCMRVHGALFILVGLFLVEILFIFSWNLKGYNSKKKSHLYFSLILVAI